MCETPPEERACQKRNSPICASDETGKQKTFNDKCLFTWAKCDDPSLIIEHPGSCEGIKGIWLLSRFAGSS